jgi:uncharacterized protein YndB with AHSA1/START domain
MAVNRIITNASPEAVYSVLSDPHTYAHWVVGASEVRGVEGAWPEPGSTFHHTQFLPKVGLKDTTTALESRAPRYLRMEVRTRPFVVAHVELSLRSTEGGTEITMTETPVRGLVGRIHNPLFDVGLHIRNIEALRRLRNLAEAE